MVATEPSGQSSGNRRADRGFTGTWNTKTDKNWTYVISLVQDEQDVTGSYVVQNGDNGQIKGTVAGNTLRFQWWQDGGYHGNGQFALANDGNSFTGSYFSDPDPRLNPNLLSGQGSGNRR